jgi:hypothetical protein
MNNDIYSQYLPMASDTGENERAEFIRKTYWHLGGAIGLFVLLEAMFISMGLGAVALHIMGCREMGDKRHFAANAVCWSHTLHRCGSRDFPTSDHDGDGDDR